MPELTIVDLPSFKPDAKRHGGREGSDTMVAIDFTRKIVLICGSSYAGEMKKSVFTTLNFYLPAENVMPMHCSANVSHEGESALFFGLSGTGKTTLSADPHRILIGDDETRLGPGRHLQFRGRLLRQDASSSRKKPSRMIWDATNRFGAVLENVVFDPDTRVPDYNDGSKTENTRSAYPLDFIPNASRTGRAGHPKNIIFLTADAYGVMPPIAKLTPDAGDVSLPLRLHGQGRRHREGPGRRSAGILHLLRRAVPAASSVGLCRPAARLHQQAQGRRLAGQFRLDRRQIRRGPPHADQGDAHAADRGARRLAEERRLPHRSLFRLLGADLGARASSRIC